MDSSIVDRDTQVMRREGIDLGAVRYLAERRDCFAMTTVVNGRGPHPVVGPVSMAAEGAGTMFPRGMVAY